MLTNGYRFEWETADGIECAFYGLINRRVGDEILLQKRLGDESLLVPVKLADMPQFNPRKYITTVVGNGVALNGNSDDGLSISLSIPLSTARGMTENFLKAVTMDLAPIGKVHEHWEIETGYVSGKPEYYFTFYITLNEEWG